MRDSSGFRKSHARLVKAALAQAGEGDEATRNLGLVELVLHFLAKCLPGTGVDAAPYLMLGYHGLVESFSGSDVVLRSLGSLRHLASRLASIAAWEEALRAHADSPPAARCYDVIDGLPARRRTASPKLLESLDRALTDTVPWSVQALHVAPPGDYRVRSRENRSVLSYSVPAVRLPAPVMHGYRERPFNPPITVSKAQLLAAAEAADAREAEPGWKRTGLEPLMLRGRLSKLRIEGIADGFWDADGERLTLDGANHLVGMLSSGKSTLVWGLLLALGRAGRRIAVLASDTVAANAMVTRLRHHGLRATVLSSARYRERHLEGIHWQQRTRPRDQAMATLGGMAGSFGTACPLDGFQESVKVVQGGGESRFPSLREKPCHALLSSTAPDGDGNQDARSDEDGERDGHLSCPLWAACPLQGQQRDSVGAEVIVMTPEAFAHMSPDRWISDRATTIPELLQFEADLVIVDEVDSVQKRLDSAFSPLAHIMGDDPKVYAPSVLLKVADSLRRRSGLQFGSPINTRWTSKFFGFFRLVGLLYSLVQVEAELAPFFEGGPFTAGSLLYDIRKARLQREGIEKVPSDDFLHVVSVAFRIARTAMADAEDGDEPADVGRVTGVPAFEEALQAMLRLAVEALTADSHMPLLASAIGEFEQGNLDAFDGTGGKLLGRPPISDRASALAVVLAVVSDLVLWHYHWLVRSQPAVAHDLGMDDGAMFGAAANLGRNYRTMIPANPAGSLFGLRYEPPKEAERRSRGGRLMLVNHLGVGRHLLAHLHDLLAHEGQAGPHVLLLSGTSWAGGRMKRKFVSPDGTDVRTEEVGSPVYDVRVPVKGVLMQPQEEVDAVSRSVFRMMPFRDEADEKGRCLRASGLPHPLRREKMSKMVQRLAGRLDGSNMIERTWAEMERRWPEGAMLDRRRAMLVVNSYGDAEAVASALSSALVGSRDAPWQVHCLVPDRDDDEAEVSSSLSMEQRLPRGMVERFGDMPERSILVAPMSVVARGHNILNRSGKAAISSIWFLHRPHPRPDDLSPVVGRLNRYAETRFEQPFLPEPGKGLADYGRGMRWKATRIVRDAMDNRGGYMTLPRHLKAPFAWDMLTPLWQTIGRGIRGGVPVFVGFVDRQFAPRSMDRHSDDDGDSSALIQAVTELECAVDPLSNEEHAVASRLYSPFLKALRRTEGLTQ